MKIKHLLTIPLLAALFSCVKDNMGEMNPQPEPEVNIGPKIYYAPDEFTVQGMVNVKIKEEALTRMSVETRSGEVVITGLPELNAATANIGAVNMERLFKHGGKYEARRQKAGLHLWYTIKFDESVSVSSVMENLSSIGDLEFVEPSLRIGLPEGTIMATATADELQALAPTQAQPNAGSSFNDPLLNKQWHYHNDGSINASVAGCDINLFPAWEITTGHPDVIVHVVDGGVDTEHEDLKPNIWTDENGYHGYNFCDDNPVVTPTFHGTHVAGTIAAVNNNGKGVSGIAGGNGNPNTGVKIMTSQIFKASSRNPGSDNLESASGAILGEALAFGADNGAVISQNSWGFQWERVDQELPEFIKDAIDYFIDYAGTDETGETQVGPMKGGIVIFAASNDGVNGKIMPAAYERVFTVAASGPNFRKPWYSNWGYHVEITAPGGDMNGGKSDPRGVWSTLPATHGFYGTYQGTSMACPHVSGVAALVVSHLGVGKKGFTNDQLWDILVNSVLDVNVNQYNPGQAGQMGAGYIDAFKALSGNTGIAPSPAADFNAAWQYDKGDFTWSVTKSSDGIESASYEILISKSDLTGASFDNPPAGASKIMVNRLEANIVDGIISTTVKLDPATDYFASITCLDRYGNRSGATMITGSTTANMLPSKVKLSAIWGLEKVDIHWSVTGDDNKTKATSYDVLISMNAITDTDFDNPSDGVTKKTVAVGSREIGDDMSVTFESLSMSTEYHIAVAGYNSANDRSALALLSGETSDDYPPTVAKQPVDVYFPSFGAKYTMNIENFFFDVKTRNLEYTVTAEPASAVGIDVRTPGEVVFTALKYGPAKIRIEATDIANQSVAVEFSTICRDDSQPMDLYPNPVSDQMNIRLGRDVKGAVDVAIYNTAGRLALSEKVAMSTFEPGKVDVSELQPGSYNVVVTYNGKETKGTITKY